MSLYVIPYLIFHTHAVAGNVLCEVGVSLRQEVAKVAVVVVGEADGESRAAIATPILTQHSKWLDR